MTNTLSIARRIDEILALDETAELVARYFASNVENPFGGPLFDTLGSNPVKRFVADDLLALNVLDEKVSPPAMRALLDGHADAALARVRWDVDLWSGSDHDLRRANDLWSTLIELPSIGPTRASKLCARKRPRLIPIRDSVVTRVLELGTGGWWSDYRVVLSDADRRRRIARLTPRIRQGYKPSCLRVADVAIWVLGSSAGSAIDARVAVGLPEAPKW